MYLWHEMIIIILQPFLIKNVVTEHFSSSERFMEVFSRFYNFFLKKKHPFINHLEICPMFLIKETSGWNRPTMKCIRSGILTLSHLSKIELTHLFHRLDTGQDHLTGYFFSLFFEKKGGDPTLISLSMKWDQPVAEQKASARPEERTIRCMAPDLAQYWRTSSSKQRTSPNPKSHKQT